MQRLSLSFVLLLSLLAVPSAVCSQETGEWRYIQRARESQKKGQYDKAIDDFTRMIWLVAGEASTHVLHSATWAAEGEYRPALDEFQQALELQQVLAAAFASRGYVWDTKGDYGKALDDFNLAVRIQPKYAECQNGLAWILATCPDERYRNGKDALRFATQACQLDGQKIAGHFDTLAAAYAETGDFDNAQKWQKKALATNTDEKVKQDCQSWLKLYQQHKPYRDVKKVSGR
jgi:tetratricopeptide (TPR) repeat protein